MAARSAMPYGTWRGSSSSRISGLMKRSLATRASSRRPLEEVIEGGGGDAVPEEEPAFGAVHGLAVGAAGHLEEDVTEPVIGRIAEPRLARGGILRVDEGLA